MDRKIQKVEALATKKGDESIYLVDKNTVINEDEELTAIEKAEVVRLHQERVRATLGA